MFEKVFIEKDLMSLVKTEDIMSRLPQARICVIDNYEDVFGKLRKPYLLKRMRLDLFLAKKRGDLLKATPPAYGSKDVPRFYFVHQYNCIFECEYCFLQGYFDSPDIVCFLNHDEIAAAIGEKAQVYKNQEVWFHAGEFSDNLALSSLLDDWAVYWECMAQIPWARLELRSKSAAIKSLLKLPPLKNIVVSFSLGTAKQVSDFDHKTAPLASRLKAAKQLSEYGYAIGWHFDPIIADENIAADFRQIAEQSFAAVPKPQYISIGMLRFSDPVYRAMQRHYPKSQMHHPSIQKHLGSKLSYPSQMRDRVLSQIESILLETGYAPELIYRCMEEL
jgi:spore photoproduct lyase